MRDAHAVYRSHHRIPELGAEPGDMIVVDPSEPVAPVSIVREFGAEFMPLVLAEAQSLEFLTGRALNPGPRLTVLR